MARLTVTKELRAELLDLVASMKGVQISNMDKGFERWRIPFKGSVFFITCNLSTKEIKSISQE